MNEKRVLPQMRSEFLKEINVCQRCRGQHWAKATATGMTPETTALFVWLCGRAALERGEDVTATRLVADYEFPFWDNCLLSFFQ